MPEDSMWRKDILELVLKPTFSWPVRFFRILVNRLWIERPKKYGDIGRLPRFLQKFDL